MPPHLWGGEPHECEARDVVVGAFVVKAPLRQSFGLTPPPRVGEYNHQNIPAGRPKSCVQ